MSYADISYADTFLVANILDSQSWIVLSATKKTVCLNQATILIDTLKIKGTKTVSTQDNKFPRDPDTTVPTPVKSACSLIAFAIATGKDVDFEHEQMNEGNVNFGLGKQAKKPEELDVTQLHGIPSYFAWLLLTKYLSSNENFTLERVT